MATPRSRAIRSTASMTCPKKPVTAGTATPMALSWPDRKLRAIRLGTYRSPATACRTRARTSSETYRSLFITRDTVFALTPASLATSRIVLTDALLEAVAGPCREDGSAPSMSPMTVSSLSPVTEIQKTSLTPVT